MPEIMFERVVWSARETANPTSPERVRTENSEVTPVSVRTPAAASTTQRTLNPRRTVRTTSDEAPALLAILVMTLISTSPTNQEPAIVPATWTTKMMVLKSTKYL